MSGYIGKDGFAWFFGVVEDRNDPKKIGRVRVRIFGYHSSDKKELPKKDLPWAMPIQGITSAGSDGIGASPTGLKEGSWVFGFFADSGSYQIPMVLGSLSGLNCKAIKELNEQNGVATSELFSFPKTASSILNQIKYPSGKNKDGDDHGAQLPDQSKQSPLQRTEYSADSTKSNETPDTNILAINDKERLDKTIVQAKRKPRSEGGAQDDEIPTADIDFPKFKSGVINESGVNKGTNKSMATGYNGVSSSSEPSKKETAKQVKDKPTNSSGQPIFSNGSSGYNSAFSSFLPGLAYGAACTSEGSDGAGGTAGGAGGTSVSRPQNTYKDITQNIKNGSSDIKKNIEDLNIKNYGKPLIGSELLKQLSDANTASNEEKQNNVTTSGISLPRSKDQNKNLSKSEPTDGSAASEHCADCD